MTPEQVEIEVGKRIEQIAQKLFVDRAYQLGIDDFKSALRKEIERERDRLKELLDKGIDDFHAESMACAKCEAFNYTLSKLDSVTPPKQ